MLGLLRTLSSFGKSKIETRTDFTSGIRRLILAWFDPNKKNRPANVLYLMSRNL